MITLENIPNELLIYVIQLLPLKNIITLSKVNKLFFKLTKENKKWKFDNNINDFSFINHCNKIEHFEDFSLNYKYYIFDYLKLNKNNLKTIHIRINNIYDLFFIKNNKDLKNLKIKYSLNLESDCLLELFDHLKYLKNISIDNTNVDDKIIDKINNYKLKTLSLEACINIKKISKINQPNLKKIEIINYNKNNTEEIIELIKKQKKLEELNLSFCNTNIFTVSIISDNSSNLTKLNLSYSYGFIDDLSAYMISNNCIKLRDLYLNNSVITNHGIFFITRGCKLLKNLGIAGTLIKDYSLIEISNYLPNLEKLETEFNDITRIGIYNLLLKCKKIKYLNILNDNFNIKYIHYIFNKVNN